MIIIMVSCIIMKGQCVVGIPNNQILISGTCIITWQVLGRQNEGTTHISNGGNYTKPASPVLHCRNLDMN